MKKFLKSILVFLAAIPIMVLCSCSSVSELPKINLSRYYNNSVSVQIYGSSSTSKKVSLDSLTSSSPNNNSLDSYTQFILDGNGSWLYKMYIDTVSFYVFTSSETADELVINFKMTNLVDESQFQQSSRTPEDVSTTRSLKPTQNGSFLCTIPIKKTIADATTTQIIIDIFNSTNGTVADTNGKISNFKWQIYGFEIYGESRAYSK